MHLYAPVVKGISRRPPEPEVGVRIPAGVPLLNRLGGYHKLGSLLTDYIIADHSKQYSYGKEIHVTKNRKNKTNPASNLMSMTIFLTHLHYFHTLVFCISYVIIITVNAPVAQGTEHRIPNPGVAGSIPARRTRLKLCGYPLNRRLGGIPFFTFYR